VPLEIFFCTARNTPINSIRPQRWARPLFIIRPKSRGMCIKWHGARGPRRASTHGYRPRPQRRMPSCVGLVSRASPTGCPAPENPSTGPLWSGSIQRINLGPIRQRLNPSLFTDEGLPLSPEALFLKLFAFWDMKLKRVTSKSSRKLFRTRPLSTTGNPKTAARQINVYELAPHSFDYLVPRTEGAVIHLLSGVASFRPT